VRLPKSYRFSGSFPQSDLTEESCLTVLPPYYGDETTHRQPSLDARLRVAPSRFCAPTHRTPFRFQSISCLLANDSVFSPLCVPFFCEYFHFQLFYSVLAIFQPWPRPSSCIFRAGPSLLGNWSFSVPRRLKRVGPCRPFLPLRSGCPAFVILPPPLDNSPPFFSPLHSAQ